MLSCQPPGVSNLITIRPVNKDNTYYIEQQYSPGSRKRRWKEKQKKKKIKKIKEKITKKRKQKVGQSLYHLNNLWMENYDVTFSDFVNDDNNAQCQSI